MQEKHLFPVAAALATVLAAPTEALATNGMNMEAYGARAGGMGGAAYAYDAGNSAVMNNPATLSLPAGGMDRLGLGLTVLGPDVTSRYDAAGARSESDGTAYYMPSVSYMRKRGRITYGAAVLAQGGMGTEYGRADDPADLFYGGLSMMNAPTLLSGQEIRSEVGVGRLMLPVAVEVGERLGLAAQLDLVWAGMDLQMDLSGAQFADLVNPMSHQLGEASGTMVDGFNAMIGGGMIQDVHWARFDFSNHSHFTGEAVGFGYGAKLGLVYRVSDSLTVGASYHSKTRISDLEAGDATLSFRADFDTGEGTATQTIPVSGEVTVKDFQWPETYGLGVAWRVNGRLMLAADVTRINWSGAMSDFRMVFTADDTPANGDFAGTRLDSTLYQDWDDQYVFAFGGQYRATPALTLRLGMNVATNPIPGAYLNPLFPAIVERHYTAGFGYAFNERSQLGVAVAYAPEVTQTNDAGVASDHGQFTWRVNYVHRF